MVGLRPGLDRPGPSKGLEIRKKPRPPAVPWAFALVLCLGVGLSIAAYFLVLNLQKTNRVQAFEGPAQEYAIAVSKALDGHLELVKSAGAFFNASNEIDRWEFFQFAREALPRHPGIQAIEWVPRVTSAQRPAYEERAQADGLFGFRFIELEDAGQVGEGQDGGGARTGAALRAEHFPIYFVEPFDGNEAELGRDLATSESALAALTQSRDSGRMILAPPRDRSAPHSHPELVVLQPVYATKTVPKTAAERAASLLGFARGVLRLGNLAYAVRSQVTAIGGLDVYIFDRADPNPSLLYHLSQSNAVETHEAAPYRNLVSGLSYEREHELAGQNWSIVIAPSHAWRGQTTRFNAWLVLTLGLLLTALLLQHLLASRQRTHAIERAVTLRTAELREANLALEEEVQERKRAESEMRAAKEEAEKASNAKTDFLAMIGHELRTPLNAVIGFSEILQKETLGPLENAGYRDIAGDILSSGQNLLSIINDILDFTRLETDNFDLDHDTLDIGTTVSEFCEAARAKTVEADLDLTVRVSRDTPYLMASRQAVTRILDNLLSNAVKFTPSGGQVTVNCATVPSGGVIIEISDTGIGIPPETQKQIFQPFAQADQSLSRRHEGTGLGLTLTLRLVELHGGVLELDSQIGEGTTVRVIFPAERSLHPGDAKEVAGARAG